LLAAFSAIAVWKGESRRAGRAREVAAGGSESGFHEAGKEAQ